MPRKARGIKGTELNIVILVTPLNSVPFMTIIYTVPFIKRNSGHKSTPSLGEDHDYDEEEYEEDDDNDYGDDYWG